MSNRATDAFLNSLMNALSPTILSAGAQLAAVMRQKMENEMEEDYVSIDKYYREIEELEKELETLRAENARLKEERGKVWEDVVNIVVSNSRFMADKNWCDTHAILADIDALRAEKGEG